MGRFYQTDKPTFVEDNMLTLPYQMMGQVIANADAQVAQQETTLMKLFDSLDAPALKQDEGRLKEILTGYEGEIDELTRKIQENPLEFRRKSPKLTDVARRIQKDFTKGEVAAISGNYQQYQDFLKRGREAVKAGDVKQDDLTFASNKFLSEFKGTSYEDGVYNTIKVEDLNKFVNMEDIAETRGKDYADSVIQEQGLSFSPDGRFIINTDGTEVPYENIFSGVLSALQNDQELNAYLGQQMRLGKMSKGDYSNALVDAATRVADKYSFKKRKQDFKADPYALEELKQRNRKSLAKFKKELEEPDVFSPVFSRTSSMLDPKQFTPDNIAAYSSSLEDDIENLKKVNTDSMDEDQLRSHNWDISNKQAALNRLNSIQDIAYSQTMQRMKDDGIITEEDYQNFLDYENNKRDIDSIVVPVIESINNTINSQTEGLNQQELHIERQQNIGNALKVLEGKIKNDPKFAEAYKKYNAGKAAYYDLNKGDKIQLIDGLAITLQDPNAYLKKWYKDNSDQNTLYSSAISIVPEIEVTEGKDKGKMIKNPFIDTLDEMAIFSSADAKVYSTTDNQFNPDGSTSPKELNLEIDDSFFGSNDRFSLNNILEKTGKKPSEIFNVKGIEPSANGMRVIYEYDEEKIQEAGIDELEGIKDGQRFIMEFPNTGIETVIRDKFARDKNVRAVEIAKAFTDPIYMHISNQVDDVIKDATAKNFKAGPLGNIFVDGLRLNINAEKNPYSGFKYNVSGVDQNNGKEFSFSQGSADMIKLYIRNYLTTRNSGNLK